MRPRKFEFFEPHTVEQVLNLLERFGDDGKILAGGLSLIPLMRLRLAEPKCLIDVTKIPHLSYVVEGDDGGLNIGALTTHHTLDISRLVKSKCPILSETASWIGDTQVRNRGTIGGNLAHADPACDYGPVILSLNAQLKTVSSKGERTIKASDFFVDLFTTALQPNELLTEVKVPSILPKTGQTYLKLTHRSGDFPIVSAAVVLTLKDGNVCSAISISLGGVGPIPVKAKKAEKALLGKTLSDSQIEEASELAISGIDPSTDIHASAEYRSEMTKVITRRALKEAFSRAGGEK